MPIFTLLEKKTGRQWTWNELAGMDTKGRKRMPCDITARFAQIVEHNPKSTCAGSSDRYHAFTVNKMQTPENCLCWVSDELCPAHS